MPEASVDTVPAAPEPDAGEIRNDQDAIKAVEALLAAPRSAEPETVPDDPEPAEMPGDLTALAERLQATPEKLYGVKVPMADGESRTLGELKDGYRTAQALTKERGEFQTERTTFDQERRQALDELERVIRHLPAEALNPDALHALRAAHNERLQRELAQLLEREPEWKDPVKYASERPGIEEYAAGFGFTAEDLAQISDHRVLRVLRDAARMRTAAKAERVKPPVKVAQAPKPGKTASPAQEWGRVKAAVTSRRLAPEAAVAQLLKDSGYGR